MDNEYSIYQVLSDIENNKNIQWLIVVQDIKYSINLINSLFKDEYNTISNIFNTASKIAFGISEFNILWQVQYDKIYKKVIDENYFKKKFNEKLWIACLEFLVNFFIVLVYTAKTQLKYPQNHQETWKFPHLLNKFYHFTKCYEEIIKLVKLFGYSFYETKSKIFEEEKTFHKLIKTNTSELIEKNIKQEKELKTLLLELTLENISNNEKEKIINLIYINFLENEKKQIAKILGNKICNDMFKLINNGFIKHKTIENMKKNSKFNWKRNYISI